MLKTKVLVTDVNNLTDARYFAAWIVDWMSFNLDPERAQVLSIEQIIEIKNWVEGPKFAIQLPKGFTEDQLFELTDKTEIDGLILHQDQNFNKDHFGAMQLFEWAESSVVDRNDASNNYLHISSAEEMAKHDMTSINGINVKGGDEEKAGFKLFDELDLIFEGLEA